MNWHTTSLGVRVDSLSESVYGHLPVFMQNVVLSGYGWLLDRRRYKGRFKEYVQFLEASQWWCTEQLRVWQEQQFVKLAKYAISYVPYYRELAASHRFGTEDIHSIDDLHRFPLLYRKDIISNFDAMISECVPRSALSVGHTSGTTGSPLQILHDNSVTEFTYAMLDRQYRWAGANYGRGGDRFAVLRGNVIVPLSQRCPPYWRYNRTHNQLLLSAFHLSDATVPDYLEAIRRFDPAVIEGYPSTLYLLARFILNELDRPFPVRAVVSASESLYPFQREAIEQAFDCRVYDYLAAAERVVFSTECSAHDGHHLAMEYGVTEFLDRQGREVSAGSPGTIVATSLHNFGMPLIRYVTNDVSALKTQECSCGRGLPLMEDVTTKAEDIISLSDGRMISPSVLTHPFKPMTTVAESQIVQLEPDRIEIRIVPKGNFRSEDAEHLLREFRQRLGDGVDIRITPVAHIPRSKSGKFKWVVSHVADAIQIPEG